jgi:hypothetical protein
MNKPQRGLISVALASALAILACSPLSAVAPRPTATHIVESVAQTSTPASASAATPTTASAGEATPTAASAGEATATTAASADPPTGPAATEAATATTAASGDTPTGPAPTEAATEAVSPTYDSLSAQLTMVPLFTAAAATATAATGSLRQWATAAQASSQYGDTSWSAQHATGAPDAPTDCGDETLAWASASNSGQDNLTLAYTTPVVPVAVNIYEQDAPGSIVKVEVDEADGTPHIIFTGVPLVSKTCPRLTSIGITGVTAHVSRVKLYVDQSVIHNWDEIDAVELVGNP